MNPNEKSTLNLPIGTIVWTRYDGRGTITNAFDHPEGNGPQYRVEWDSGDVTESIHQNNVVWVADAPKPAVTFRTGDHVKFRHNNKTGVVRNIRPCGYVTVEYARTLEVHHEDPKNLVLLYSPAAKAAEGPHPMQPALDAIDEERRKVGLQITALQIRSSELKKAKELLIRGE